jgi:hypothetical protein
MSREAANKIVSLILRHGAEQDQVLIDIQPICSPDEFEMYKQMIGRSMGGMLLDVLNPIFEKHPDLKPPQLE